MAHRPTPRPGGGVKRPVEVTWVDSVLLNFGWQHPMEYQDSASEPAVIRSVGYVIHRTKTHLTLTMNVGNNGQITSGITIPTGCIRRVRRL